MTYIDDEAIENRNRFGKFLDDRNQLDIKGLQESAEASEAAKHEAVRLQAEKEQQAMLRREAKIGDLLSKTAESMKVDNKALADAKIEEETERKAKEIRDRYNKEFNVKEETDIDRGLRSLLDGMKE